MYSGYYALGPRRRDLRRLFEQLSTLKEKVSVKPVTEKTAQPREKVLVADYVKKLLCNGFCFKIKVPINQQVKLNLPIYRQIKLVLLFWFEVL